MRLKDTFYRGHDPRWSFSPLSGEGAKVHGGRFNPPGVDALYLASTILGAIAEMGHGFAHRLVPPMTIVSYEVDVDDIVDLTMDQGRRAANVDLADMACAWRLDLVNGREPASWRIAERLGQTAPGILVPSFARDASQDMHNLVLWKWGPDLPYRVSAYDPSGRLPKNQLSWT